MRILRVRGWGHKAIGAGALILLLGGVVQAQPAGALSGGVRVGHRIVFDGGAVVVDTAPLAPGSCPDTYVCLFQGINFGGDVIQFHDCCAWNNLSDYGFNNEASSWKNRKNVDAQIATGSDGNGNRLCLNDNDSDSNMGSWADSASSIRVRDAGNYC